MPRVAITLTIVGDEGETILREGWSPLSYEDLGNPNLNDLGHVRRNLLDRLRTSIDRTLLSFARRERRIWDTRTNNYATTIGRVDGIIDDYTSEYTELPNPIIELTEAQRLALVAEQPVVEVQREAPKKKRGRPIKRVSRYKRDPVI